MQLSSASRGPLSILATAGVLCTSSSAQSYRQFTFDLNHRISLAQLPISGDLQASARYFDHTWIQDQYSHGIAWDVVPPWTGFSPPAYPLPQPPTFNPYGIEFFGWFRDYYNPWSWHYASPTSVPFNGCVDGYTSLVPACGAAVSAVTLGDTHGIPSQGTGGPWITTSSVPSSPLTFASSEIEVQPTTSGSGGFDGRVRSTGQYHFDTGVFGNKTYAFAWTELECLRMTQPSIYPPGIPVSYSALSFGAQSSVPTWWPPNSQRTTRVWDPITFSLTELSTGQTTTGKLFDLYVDLAERGSVSGGSAGLWLDTAHGGLRVRMEHPLITPRGSIDLELENGVVVTSRATGAFASMGLPPVGAASPMWIQFPSSTFDFVFDHTPLVPGDAEVTLRAGGAGAYELPEPEPTGAACLNGVCTSGVTEAQALALGATWQGPGTACPEVPYTVAAARVGFEDIELLGIASIAGGCDDCGENVPIGFAFDYFGTLQTTVGISSNGYLAFSGALNAYLNAPLPSAAGPNGVIAGFWDDLDPLAGGDVHYATLGAAPFRRFIAQWSGVPHYNAYDTLHTFQIVLSETTNEIVLRYLDTPPIGGAISPTIGIEDPTGANGLALAPESIEPAATRRLSPAPGSTCAPTATAPYCTGGTTSHGCVASMSATGAPSVSSSSGFVVTCNQVEGQKAGLIFYGVTGPATQMWGAGSTSLLCVKAPLQRTNVTNSGGAPNTCNGVLAVDFASYLTTHPGALGSPFVAGQVCWMQCWFRDPPAVKTTNLSNGLRVTFQP